MATNVPTTPPWTPPSLLKAAHDWKNILALIFYGISIPASIYLGKEKGALLGSGSAILFTVLFVAYTALARTNAYITAAVDVLSTSTYTATDARAAVVSGLQRWRRFVFGMVIVLSAVAGTSLVAVVYPTVVHRVTIATPETIPFASFDYYQPGDKMELVKSAPFMEGVISALTAEGEAQKTPYRIAMGTTAPFSHPTPRFRSTLVIEGGSYDVTGYAFRRHQGDGRTTYEPIVAEYPEPTSVFFDIPPSEKGDQIVVVALVTLREATAFPENLTAGASLKTVD